MTPPTTLLAVAVDLDNISLSTGIGANAPIPTLGYLGMLAMALLLILAGRRFITA